MIPQIPPRFNNPDRALENLARQIQSVAILHQQSPLTGRILAADVMADRDSPAADVSAMDGYAIRMSDLDRAGPIPIGGESAPGSPPPAQAPGSVVRVFTGAIVPTECDAVVKREETMESTDSVQLLDSARTTAWGAHIRRAGENASEGSRVLSAGIPITAAVRATMANFGCRRVDLFSKVRVSVVTTGDEVGVFTDEAPKPWQLRNSNRESISAILELIPWVEIAHLDHCRDDRDAMFELLTDRLEDSDAILLTGGVSMGDYDYVPDVIRDVGGNVAFHGLPIRPGKPILGASTTNGKLFMGLPGNPVSATIGCRRMALPLLAKMAGLDAWTPAFASVRLRNPDDKKIPLHWMRLVRIVEPGVAELIASLGSGDLVSLGASSGFVELPPGAQGEGPWPYIAWV